MKSIFFYKKAVARKIGYAAGYCKIERALTCHRVDEVRIAWHMNFFRLTSGDFVRRDSCCTSCTLKTVDDITDYRSFTKSKSTPIQWLVEETNPSASSVFREQILIGEKLSRGEFIDSTSRAKLINEQFDLIESSYRKAASGVTKMDRVSGWAAVLSLPIWLLVTISLTKLMPDHLRMDALLYGMYLGFGLLIANAYLFFTGPRRELERALIPLVKRALAPLKLSKLELSELLLNATKNGSQFPKAFGEKKLLTLVRQS